jgi:DNA-binding CsgD family transcriptional regulator
MDNDEVGRVGGLESNDVAVRFRPEEPPSRLWAQPMAKPRPSKARDFERTGSVSVGTPTSERGHAIERDLTTGGVFDLAELWRRLGACEWQVHDTFATDARLYATVVESDVPRRRPGSDAGLAMIEQILVGQSSKALAIERRVSDSTVALTIKKRLQLMGLTCKVRGMPLILALAARSACGRVREPLFGRIAFLGGDAPHGRWVVSVAHPDFRIPKLLSTAERAVLSHALEGKTYVQIATARDTSLRTVANQLASVFRKLGVSGYGETLDLLLSRTFEPQARTTPDERLPRARLKSRSSFSLRAVHPPH